MTISATTNRVQYSGSGSMGPFTVPYRFQSSSDLLVTKRSSVGTETTLTITTHYTVSGAGDATGSITLVTALAVGETLTIRRAPALTQPTSLRNQSSFFGATHEDAFDRLVMQVQALDDRLRRTFGYKETYDPTTLSLLLAGETGKVLGWDSATQLVNKALDSSATALPGGGRTVATVSAYLANNAVFNVKDFGALGDGSADDTAEIQACLDAAIAVGGRVRFPYGVYVISSTLTIDGSPTTGHGWIIEGDGAAYESKTKSSVIKWAGASGGTMFRGRGLRWVEINRILFDGNSLAGTGLLIQNGPAAEALSAFRSSGLVIRDVTQSPGRGVQIGDATGGGIADIRFDELNVLACTTGVYLNNAGCQDIKFFGGYIQSCTTGVYIKIGTTLDLFQVDMSANTRHVDCETGGTVNFHGGYYEDGTLLRWQSHNGFAVNCFGVVKTQSAGTPAIFEYAGGNCMLTSIGSSWPYGIDLSAAAGNNELLAVSLGDIFTTSGWTRCDRLFIVEREAAGKPRLVIGNFHRFKNDGTQTRFANEQIPTVGDADATPSVLASNHFISSAAGATITDFDDGLPGQLLTIRFQNGSTTITHDVNKIYVRGAANVTPAANTVMQFIKSDIWREVARTF